MGIIKTIPLTVFAQSAKNSYLKRKMKKDRRIGGNKKGRKKELTLKFYFDGKEFREIFYS